jgi:hypothetical protein
MAEDENPRGTTKAAEPADSSTFLRVAFMVESFNTSPPDVNS